MPISPSNFGPAPGGGLEAAVVQHAIASNLFGAKDEAVKLGRYAVLRRIGAGRLGVVYAAFDPELRREVALKVLHARGRDDLLREASMLAQIVHPNVVTVHDVGAEGPDVFLAMELVVGSTLTDWLAASHDSGEIVDVFLQAGRGLAAAHRSGVVHGDFKPDNVMVGEDGRVRVLDFGLAWAARTAEAEGPRAAGTPVFMAPEQHLGWEIDGRADQFSWSVALFQALYGQHPFDGADLTTLMQAIERGPPRVSRIRGVPREVGRALRRGMQFERDARWPSIDALIDRIEAATRSRLPTRWATVGIVVAFAALALSGDDDPCATAQHELAGVWDQDRRDAVRSALGGVDAPYAADASSAVVTRVDAYAEDWLVHYAQACRAGQRAASVPTDQGRHWRACLATRRAELAAAVDILARADEVVLSRSLELVADLEPSAACAELERLRDRPTVETDAHREALAQVRAETAAGRPHEAIAAAEAVLEEASTRAEPVARARAQYELGVARADAGDHASAADTLREAYFGAREIGLEPLAARSAIELALELALAKQSAAYAFDWVRQARVQLEAHGDARLRWRTELVAGIVAFIAGKHEEAAARFEACRALAVGHALRDAECLTHLGQTRMRLGQHEAGIDAAREVHRVLAAALPPSHPSIAGALNDLGLVLDSAGRYEEAIHAYEQAREGYASSLGPDSVKVGYALVNRGISQLWLGRLDAAQSSLEEARGVIRAAAAERDPIRATVAMNLAALYRMNDRPREALEAIDGALEIAGSIPMNVGAAHLARAGALLELGRPAEAVDAAQRGRARMRETYSPEHVEVLVADSIVGAALLANGDAKEALAELERSVQGLRHAKGGQARLPPVLIDLAEALRLLGRSPNRVEALKKEAERLSAAN